MNTNLTSHNDVNYLNCISLCLLEWPFSALTRG